VTAFRYTASDELGKDQVGVLEADSARQARQALRNQGLVPLAVEPVESDAMRRSPGALRGRRDGPLVDRAFFRERVRGDFGDDLAVIFDAQEAAFRNFADDDRVEAPFIENLQDLGFAAFFSDEQHALLRFAEHDFVGSHAGFALRDASEIDFDASAAA